MKLVSLFFEGTNTLITLEDCGASKDMKGRTGQVVSLSFYASHIGLSLWVLAQKVTSITASFRENRAAIVLFYTPSGKTTKAIIDDYAGELSQEEYRGLISKLKARKFSYLVFALRFPYGVEFFSGTPPLAPGGCGGVPHKGLAPQLEIENRKIYTMAEEEIAYSDVLRLLARVLWAH